MKFAAFSSSVLSLIALTTAAPSGPVRKNGDIIPGRYIVTMSKSLPSNNFRTMMDDLDSNMRLESGESSITHVYNFGSFRGFAGSFDEASLKSLRTREGVMSIEPDRYITINAVQENPENWGLARVGSSETEHFDSTKYEYPDSAGEGVTAYVIDTGCNPEHPDLEDRATLGKSFGSDTSMDGNGHGTHVSTTIAGKSYGVAKKAKVVCVKVLGDDGSGSFSDVVAGIAWAAEDAKGKKAVANMSLGGPASDSIDSAVKEAIESGLTFAVAAGNDASDACENSPARVPEAITVAASTKDNEQAKFSNYGSCVDVYAPGHKITAGWFDGKTKTISGTSMASPHVAGVVALYLGENLGGEEVKAANLAELVVAKGTKDTITNASPDTANVLVFANAKKEEL